MGSGTSGGARSRAGGRARVGACLACMALAAAPSAGAQDAVAQENGADFAGFAETLEGALSDRDVEVLEQAFDREAFLDAVMEGIPLPRMMRTEYRAERGAQLSLAGELCDAAREGTVYRLARVRPEGQGARALYRVWDAGTYDLVELVLAVDAQGRRRVVDVEPLRAGRSLVAARRLEFVETYAVDQAGLIKRLPEPEKSWVRSLRQREFFEHLRGRGDLEAAAEVLRNLPLLLRDGRAAHYLRMELAGERGGSAAFLEALGSCRGAYPDDLGAELHALAYFATQREDNDYLFTLGRLEQLAGPDGALDCLRAERFLARGDRRSAARCFKAAVDHEPDFADGYWGRIRMALEDGDQRPIVKLLIGLETRCGVELEGLSERAEFESFVRSKYYSRWLKQRK